MSIASISLNMIVRNEAHCIKRCLDSVRGLISHWVICDTGSTDDTTQIIRSQLAGIPGELFEDEWVNFAHNRTLGLERARGKADYHLIVDADMTLEVDAGFDPATLSADGYFLKFNGDTEWQVIRLVSDRHRWEYKGAAHEYICSDTARQKVKLPWLSLTHHQDGGSRPGRFEKYLQLLLESHKREPNDPRTVFYIAQTYKDTNRPAEAIEWYLRRLTLDGWEEETWYAAYQLACCKQATGYRWSDVLISFLDAFQLRPWRLEPLLPICQTYRSLGQFALAHMFSRPILTAPYPDDLLFIERPVYDYALLTEHAIACYWVGEHEEAVRLNERILKVPNLPANYHASAFRNRNLSLQALGRSEAA